MLPTSQLQPHLLGESPLSLACLARLRRPPPPFAGCGASRPSRLPPLPVQPHRLLLRIALGVERQKPGQHVVADGIGPAVAPGQPTAGFYAAVAAELGLEVAGF